MSGGAAAGGLTEGRGALRTSDWERAKAAFAIRETIGSSAQLAILQAAAGLPPRARDLAALV